MDWWQLLFTIISSSALTAFITGIFNFKTIKETNKENERQRKFDFDSKTIHENKLKEEQNEIQKAENLYKIISPALECKCLLFYIKEPNKYCEDAFYYLYEAISKDDCCASTYKNYTDWLKQGKFKFWNPHDLPFDKYIRSLIEQDLKRQTDLSFFFQRYDKGTSGLIEIDVIKLNKDIDFINKELNLYIEKF